MSDLSAVTNYLSQLTAAESRALELLGQGVYPEQAAAAAGLTPSRISQLLSQEQFAAAVAERRYESLSKHNARDNEYDELEDSLLTKMKDCIPLMMRPQEILRAIQVINAAKRRGSSMPQHISEQQTIINLVLPTQILTQFAMNAQNQVVSAGDQSLLTIQSGTLLKKLDRKDIQNVQAPTAATTRSAPKPYYSPEDF